MPGAAILAAESCLRSGAGLVTLASSNSSAKLMVKKITPEVILLPLSENRKGSVDVVAMSTLHQYIQVRRINVLAIGPGLTHQTGASALVRKVVASVRIPVVLDADGLNAFKAKASLLRKHSSELVLTPHNKELERVFSLSCPASLEKRAALAKKLARLYDVTIVLKGHRTLVVSRDRFYKNNTGNPGMAKGGSGDVLTGMIAAFIAQGLAPFEAACWAVYFHGKAGDLAVKEKGELGLLASDVIRFLPKVF